MTKNVSAFLENIFQLKTCKGNCPKALRTSSMVDPPQKIKFNVTGDLRKY